VVTLVIVVIDEGFNLRFKITGQEGFCRKFREGLNVSCCQTQLSSECSKLREAVTLHIELLLPDHLSDLDAFERS